MNTTYKRLRDLQPADRIKLCDPEGVAEITHVEPCTWVRFDNGPGRIAHYRIVDGPETGETGRCLDGADCEIEVVA